MPESDFSPLSAPRSSKGGTLVHRRQGAGEGRSGSTAGGASALTSRPRAVRPARWCAPLLPWPNQLLRAFGGGALYLPIAEAAFVISVFVLAPLLDLASYLGASKPWASPLHMAAGLLLLIGSAITVASVASEVIDVDGVTSRLLIRRRPLVTRRRLGLVLVLASLLTNLVMRLPYQVRSTADVRLLYIDLLVVVVAVLHSWAGGHLES